MAKATATVAKSEPVIPPAVDAYPRQWPSDLSEEDIARLSKELAKPVLPAHHGGDPRLMRRVLMKVEVAVHTEAQFDENEIWHSVHIGSSSGAFHVVPGKWHAAPLAVVELYKRVGGDIRTKAVDMRPDDTSRARLESWQAEQFAQETIYKYRVNVWEADSLPFKPWKKDPQERGG